MFYVFSPRNMFVFRKILTKKQRLFPHTALTGWDL
jgi:hypothetical protein